MKDRKEYVDAMRGLAMLMVVVMHLFLHSQMGYNKIAYLLNFRLQIPLFFMISGFFVSSIENKPVWTTLSNKFLQLVIPALFMMLLYCFVKDFDFVDCLYKNMKVGYWFTFVLFYFFLLFVFADVVIRWLTKGKKNTFYYALHFTVVLCVMYLSSFSNHYTEDYTFLGLFSVPQWWYYVFFVTGAFLYPVRNDIFNGSYSNNFIGASILIVILYNVIVGEDYCGDILKKFRILVYSLYIIVFLIVIWKTFITYNFLSSTNLCGRFLTLVGKRSLDVYFIHYFFLPNLIFLDEFFILYPNHFFSYLTAIILAIPITLASIGCGYVIRLSSLSSKILLGTK